MIITLDAETEKRLTRTECGIIQFVNAHENDLSKMSIVDIAEETFTSPASVSRAIRKCGINGFNELRYRLIQPKHDQDIASINEIMHKSLIEAEALLERISVQNLLHVVQRIMAAKAGRIYVLGRGLSSYVVAEFSLKLRLLGYNVMDTDDPNIMRNITRHLPRDSYVILFTLGGKTQEIVDAACNAYSQGVDVCVCCCNDAAPVLQYAKYRLVGMQHKHIAIKEYEVTSRVSLSIMARMIVDYLVQQEERA